MRRWTKHYYIGSERIASRTGTITSFNSLSTPDNKVAGYGLSGVSVNYGAMCGAQEDSISSIYAQFGVPYEVHRTNNRGDAFHLYLPISRTEEKDNDTAETSENNPQRNHPTTLGEGKVYFYHRDHLGSTMSVTDSVGQVAQTVEYTPWGEVFVEQRNDSICTTPYLFNGKELDEETGLYYYGARYYDPRLSVWYSVDRFAEKYPFLSPYSYGVYNPLAFLDVNGDSLKAVSRISGYRLVNEIHNTFQGKRFDKLNTLFQLSSDGKTMKGINKRQFIAAIEGLSPDEKALAKGYFKVINSNGIHWVDMTMRNEYLHKKTRYFFQITKWQTGADVDFPYGGGVNCSYANNGSFTIIVMDSSAEVDFVNRANGLHYKRHSTPAELLAHELIGHGLGRSVNSIYSRHIDPIRLSNLYWRVRGYRSFYRDGNDHGDKTILSRAIATGIPFFLK